MSKLLNEDFEQSVMHLMAYIEIAEKQKFLDCTDEEKLQNHIYLEVLKVRLAFGLEDVDFPTAQQIMKTSLVNNLYYGSEDPVIGFTAVSEMEEEITEEEYNDEYQKFVLWI